MDYTLNYNRLILEKNLISDYVTFESKRDEEFI